MASSSMSKRQKSGAWEKDIRLPIVEEILKYLPIKKIVKCKLICKAWLDLISNPSFTELQFAAAQSCILLRSLKVSVPQTLYLIEPSKISSNICYCDVYDGGNKGKKIVDTKLRIPMVYRSAEAEKGVLLEAGLAPVNDMVGTNKFYLVNSCNGFLCLNGSWKEKRTIICNPFTNEYANLPNMNVRDSARHGNVFGFGFCPLVKKYKVLRIVHKKAPKKVQCPVLGISFDTSWVTKILTVGTDSWRTIGNVPSFFRQMDSCTYVNGMLYWCNGEGSEHRIASFDFESESFKLVPKLPQYLGSSVKDMTLGTINGRLCLLRVYNIQVWVLEDVNGIKSWSKLLSIMGEITSNKWPRSVVKIASCSKCEQYYFFRGNADGGEVIYYDHKTRQWKKREVIGGIQPHFHAVVHTPTLVSLKHAMPGVEVVSPLQESRSQDSEQLYLMEEQQNFRI